MLGSQRGRALGLLAVSCFLLLVAFFIMRRRISPPAPATQPTAPPPPPGRGPPAPIVTLHPNPAADVVRLLPNGATSAPIATGARWGRWIVTAPAGAAHVVRSGATDWGGLRVPGTERPDSTFLALRNAGNSSSFLTLDLSDLGLQFSPRMNDLYHDIRFPIARWDGDTAYIPYLVTLGNSRVSEVTPLHAPCEMPDLNFNRQWEMFECELQGSYSNSNLYVWSMRPGETLLFGEGEVRQTATPPPSDRTQTTKQCTIM